MNANFDKNTIEDALLAYKYLENKNWDMQDAIRSILKKQYLKQSGLKSNIESLDQFKYLKNLSENPDQYRDDEKDEHEEKDDQPQEQCIIM